MRWVSLSFPYAFFSLAVWDKMGVIGVTGPFALIHISSAKGCSSGKVNENFYPAARYWLSTPEREREKALAKRVAQDVEEETQKEKRSKRKTKRRAGDKGSMRRERKKPELRNDRKRWAK